MLRETRDRWVAALRSGKYKQGTGYLQQNGRFCCLGVLNDIQNNPCNKRHGAIMYDSPSRVAAAHVNTEWLQSQGLEVKDVVTLMNMNDDGATFDVIADWISQNV